jgi:hypothetical protein
MDEHLKSIHVKVGDTSHLVEGLAILCGEDIILIVGGGSAYHIGSVAVAYSHPSLRNALKTTSTASVITMMGHKEDEITRSASLKISHSLNRTVTLTVGLHLDNASAEDIAILVQNFNTLVDLVIEKLEKSPGYKKVD